MNKKILFVDHYNRIGGGQSVLIDLINSFNSLGYECIVALPKGGHIEANVTFAKYYYFSNLVLNNRKKTIIDVFKVFFHYFSVLGIIKEISKTNIVYVNGSRYFLLFYIFSFFIKRKFIYHVHLDFPRWGKSFLSILNQHKNTHAIVFTSNYLLDEFLKYQGKRREKDVEKLYVLEPAFSEKYAVLEFKNRFTISKPKFNFISVGMIIPEKGFDLIIKIADIYEEHNFFIVGSPEDDSVNFFNALKKSAGKNVVFIGSSNSIPELVNSNNIHFGIVPSDWNEPFGIVATELMMCSCITFVRDRGGLKEISSKTNAFIFEDTDDLKGKINAVISNTLIENTNLAFTQYCNTKMLYNSQIFIKKLNLLIS